MVRTRAVRFLLILGLVALLIPVSLANADGHGSSGTAVIRDAVILGDPFAGDTPTDVPSGKLILSMVDVAVPEEGTALEGWLISDDGERKQSIGILEVAEDGTINHEFVADPGENLFLGFNTFVITLEPVPDDDPAPSAEISHKSAQASAVLEQVRLLLDTTGPAASVNLLAQAELAASEARKAQAAVANGDLETAKTHAECVINIVNGSADCGDGEGIGNYAGQVAAAAATAASDEDAVDDEGVAAASAATIAAANSAKESAEHSAAAAALAREATSNQVATLHLGNVARHITQSVDQAQMAYVGTQDLATYTVAPPGPSVGEPFIPLMVRYGLIASILLVLLGSVMFFGARRRSGASAA